MLDMISLRILIFGKSNCIDIHPTWTQACRNAHISLLVLDCFLLTVDTCRRISNNRGLCCRCSHTHLPPSPSLCSAVQAIDHKYLGDHLVTVAIIYIQVIYKFDHSKLAIFGLSANYILNVVCSLCTFQ